MRSAGANRLAAGVNLLAAGLIYLASEAVTAGAWLGPKYSYARNWISDLGAPVRGLYAGRPVDSPLHTLMNLGFAVSGAFFFVGALLVASAAPRGRSRAYVALAAVHALGLVLIALVPETTPGPVGKLHQVGALMAIGFGNVAVLLGSRTAARLGPTGLIPVGTILGTLGLLSLAVLIAGTTGLHGLLTAAGPGVVERAAVYPITAWEIVAGAWLLARSRR